MKSMPFVVSMVWILCTPLSAAGPPQEPELMTEEPAGDATSETTTAEDVIVADVAIFPADPGEEDPEIALTFWEARDHIAQGRWQYARTLLEDALERFPSSRHLHQQLAELLWFEYNDVSGEPDTLAAAAHHAVLAEDLALGAGRSDAGLHELTAKLLGRTGDVATLDRVFQSVFAVDPSAESHLAYGDALALAGDPRAEAAYRAAIERRPENAEARIRLAELLLLQGSYRRGLDELNRRPKVRLPYASFLRGYANERMDRPRRALGQYERFRPANESFPVPDEFRIPGSRLQTQSKIRFRTDPPAAVSEVEAEGGGRAIAAAVTSAQAITGLSYLVWGEARSETVGGMRAAGWLARNRVLRGSVPSATGSCPAVSNGGATLADRYASVMCQSGQFVGMCLAWCSNPSTTSCSNNSTTAAVADDVYYGQAPDPVGQHCPAGILGWGGTWCASTTTCRGRTDTYRVDGAVFNIGNKTYTDACNAHFCAPSNRGKVCGNSGTAGSGTDNCFYSNPQYASSSKQVVYNGSISTSGACQFSGAFSVSAGVHLGHLEGPEVTTNPDLDLYLQRQDGTAWTTVASSPTIASVEDLSHSGTTATYRWQVCSYSGTGSYRLYTKRP